MLFLYLGHTEHLKMCASHGVPRTGIDLFHISPQNPTTLTSLLVRSGWSDDGDIMESVSLAGQPSVSLGVRRRQPTHVPPPLADLCARGERHVDAEPEDEDNNRAYLSRLVILAHLLLWYGFSMPKAEGTSMILVHPCPFLQAGTGRQRGEKFFAAMGHVSFSRNHTH